MVRIGLFSIGRMDLMAKWIAHGLFPEPSQEVLREQAQQRIAANDRLAYRALMKMIIGYDQSKRMNLVQAPTLIVAGAQDGTVPLAWKRLLVEGIPGAVLQIVPESGHATPIDASDIFNRILLDFLVQNS
jgi:pimeloyl-ACP methyl ester carboxylesterase